MKRTVNFLVSLLLTFVNFSPLALFADEQLSTSELSLATQAMTSYLETRSWEDFELRNPEEILDANLEEYGYVFELYKGTQEGYGIVVEHNGGYIFAEGSIEMPSPYKSVPDSCENVYTTAFGYYSYNPLSRNSDNFLRLSTNENVSKNELANIRVEVDAFVDNSNSRETVLSTKYLLRYPISFESVVQPNGSACIPTSSIMALKYLSNTGRLTLYGSNLRTLASDLHYVMDSTLGRVNDKEAIEGIDAWTSNTSNCSRRITFESTYSYTPTVAAWNAVQTKIDGNIPVICMFRENIIGYDVTHATTMVGYQTVQLDTFDDNIVYYTIVKDPGTSGVPEKTVAWSNSNIYGYFILSLH